MTGYIFCLSNQQKTNKSVKSASVKSTDKFILLVTVNYIKQFQPRWVSNPRYIKEYCYYSRNFKFYLTVLLLCYTRKYSTFLVNLYVTKNSCQITISLFYLQLNYHGKILLFKLQNITNTANNMLNKGFR